MLVLMQVWWSFRRVFFCMPLCWSFTGASNRRVGFCMPLCWSFIGTSNRRVGFCMPLCWSFTGTSNRRVGFCMPLCWSFIGTSNTLIQAKPFAWRSVPKDAVCLRVFQTAGSAAPRFWSIHRDNEKKFKEEKDGMNSTVQAKKSNIFFFLNVFKKRSQRSTATAMQTFIIKAKSKKEILYY